MKKSKTKYGSYIREMCCDDCDYAGKYNAKGWCPLEPVQICPDCGGHLSRQVGRWMYTETPYLWFDFLMIGCQKTIYHGFVKGRDTNINPSGTVKKLSCDCDGCKISDSGHGYQPCHHNGIELGKPPGMS